MREKKEKYALLVSFNSIQDQRSHSIEDEEWQESFQFYPRSTHLDYIKHKPRLLYFQFYPRSTLCFLKRVVLRSENAFNSIQDQLILSILDLGLCWSAFNSIQDQPDVERLDMHTKVHLSILSKINAVEYPPAPAPPLTLSILSKINDRSTLNRYLNGKIQLSILSKIN